MNKPLISLVTSTVLMLSACGTLSARDKDLRFTKKVDVFGITIAATDTVPNDKLLHAASVMAEYLDNNQDGTADNPELVQAMQNNKAVLVMVERERDMEYLDESMLEDVGIEMGIGQDLYAEETHPNGAERQVFDASLEEVLHLISHAGYEQLYPEIFSTDPDSAQSKAMDVARGGHFKRNPRRYPESAWYSYYDPTCDYECQGGEYFYWALTTMLGAQDYPWRKRQIADEWRLTTPTEFANTDKAMHQLLSSPIYKLPTVLPTGQYTGMKLTVLPL